jgi:periplasmic divalent cation tolerance protein
VNYPRVFYAKLAFLACLAFLALLAYNEHTKGGGMEKYIVVISTVPDEDTGHKIASAILSKRLAACVTMTSASQSLYWWQGKILQEQEHILFIKSQNKLYPNLEKMILELHPYEVPEVISLPVVRGFSRYLDWIAAETSSCGDEKET